ncbi:MAG: hypothetical protein ACRDKF_08910 [Actinomycetota bacterium]
MRPRDPLVIRQRKNVHAALLSVGQLQDAVAEITSGDDWKRIVLKGWLLLAHGGLDRYQKLDSRHAAGSLPPLA